MSLISSEEVLSDIIESMMMESPVMIRDNEHRSDDRGGDDMRPSRNDELDHNNMNEENSAVTPSWSETEMQDCEWLML